MMEKAINSMCLIAITILLILIFYSILSLDIFYRRVNNIEDCTVEIHPFNHKEDSIACGDSNE